MWPKALALAIPIVAISAIASLVLVRQTTGQQEGLINSLTEAMSRPGLVFHTSIRSEGQKTDIWMDATGTLGRREVWEAGNLVDVQVFSGGMVSFLQGDAVVTRPAPIPVATSRPAAGWFPHVGAALSDKVSRTEELPGLIRIHSMTETGDTDCPVLFRTDVDDATLLPTRVAYKSTCGGESDFDPPDDTWLFENEFLRNADAPSLFEPGNLYDHWVASHAKAAQALPFDALWLGKNNPQGLSLVAGKVDADHQHHYTAYALPDSRPAQVEDDLRVIEINQWASSSGIVPATSPARCSSPREEFALGSDRVVVCRGRSTIVDVFRGDTVIEISAQLVLSRDGADLNPFNDKNALVDVIGRMEAVQ